MQTNDFSNLPNSWQIKTLGEISRVITGKTPSKSHKEYFGGTIPFVKPSDLDKKTFIDTSEDTLTELGFKHAPFIPKNSVLVSCIGNLGKKAILSVDGSCNQQLNAIIPNENLDYKFLYYQIDIIKFWMERNASATTVTILNKSKFEKAPIILPPLEIQKRIVARLESAFEKIEKGSAHLQDAKTKLAKYKQSLLKSAFDGTLTAAASLRGVEKAETIHKVDCHDLTSSNLAMTDKENPKLPQGWTIKTLGEIGEIISGGTPSTKQADNFGGDIAWITPADLSNHNDKFISQGKRNISEKGLKNSSARLVPKGTILFSSRAPIGYVAIASNQLCTNQGFKNLIPNKNVSSEFVYYYLLNSKNLAESYASGTTFKEISAKSFSKLPIPLPPLEIQKQIVKLLEKHLQHADKTGKFIESALNKAKQLKQSLLKSAFLGKLT